MLKFESYLAINNNNNKNNNASYNKKIRLALCLYSYDYTLLILKKATKMVSCYIVWNLTNKPMSTFRVDE